MIDRALEHRLGGDVGLDLVTGDELDVVDGEDVGGIAHGDHEATPAARHRECHELDRQLAGNQLGQRRIGLVAGEVDAGGAVEARQECQQLLFGDGSDLEQAGDEGPAQILLLLGRLAEGDLVDETSLHQLLCDVFLHE